MRSGARHHHLFRALPRGSLHAIGRSAALRGLSSRCSVGGHGPLWHDVRACSAPSHSRPPPGTLTTLLQTVVTTLHAVGPCPLSKLSTSLPDDVAEAVACSAGGLLSLCQHARHAVHVVFVDAPRKGQQRVPVAIPQTSLTHVARADFELVSYVSALLAVAKWTPWCSVLGDAEPLASDVLVAVHRSSLPAHVRLKLRNGLAAMQQLVRQHGSVLALDATGKRVRLVNPQRQPSDRKALRAPGSTSSATVNPASSLPLPSAPRYTPWQRFVVRTVPSSFFVPLSYVVSQKSFAVACTAAGGNPVNSVSVLSVFTGAQERGEVQLVQLPPLSAEALPPPLSGAYVRCLLIDNHVTPEAGEGIAMAEEVACAASLDPLALTQSVAEAIAACAHSSDNLLKLRLIKGLSAQDVVDVLPSPLVDRLKHFFTCAQSSSDTTEKAVCAVAGHTAVPSGVGERAILLLDRMRHLFDVDLSAMRVRPWSVLPAEDLPSGLTSQTSPSPLLLSAFQSRLRRHGPQSVSDLVDALPPVLLLHLLALYDMTLDVSACPWSGAESHRREAEALLNGVPVATRVHACSTFLSQHPLYFTEQNGFVYTPELLANRGSGLEAPNTSLPMDSNAPDAVGDDIHSLSEQELVDRIAAVLPKDEAQPWSAAQAQLAAHGLPKDCLTIDMVARAANVFSTYEPFLGGMSIIGLKSARAPAPELLQPQLTRLDDIIKYMAIKSCGGASENIIVQSLPSQTRAQVKLRVGSLTSLAEQLPEWFSVRRDIHNEGASIITYIGASASATVEVEGAPERVLQPMRNVGHRTWRHEPLND